MADMTWRDAITKVLEESPSAMHYTEIAETIAEKSLRNEFGANPATSVNVVISNSLKTEGLGSPFVRVEAGRYWLRSLVEKQPRQVEEAIKDSDEAGFINAFGMYWARDSVLWTSAPRILGQQQVGSAAVDFTGQRGVYLLYDGRSVVYVGRAIDQPLGNRLRQHLGDRLNGRWNRFSWFGIYRVSEEGQLILEMAPKYDPSILIATMEALLIEGLEPPQNRKRGDEFRAVEFLQVEDPEMQKAEIIKLIDELKKKL